MGPIQRMGAGAVKNHIYHPTANATRLPAGQSREPVLPLKEIAEKLGVPFHRLCGFMAHGDAPKAALLTGRAKTPHYRLSEFKVWWAALLRTGQAG